MQTIQEPDGRLLFVPVRPTGCGAITLRTARSASGERIGPAFTSEAALVATLGAGQEWINLAGPLVPGMFAEAGVTETRIDPLPVPLAVPVPVVPPASASAVPAVPQRARVRSARRPVRHAARPTAVRHAY